MLPDSMNFFNRGGDDGNELDFKSRPKNTNAQPYDKFGQIEDEMASFVDEDMLLNAFKEDSYRNKKNKAQKKDELIDSDDKEVEDLFKDTSEDEADLNESLKRQLDA